MKQSEAKRKESGLWEYVVGRKSTVGFTKDGFRPTSPPSGSEESVRRLGFRGANVVSRGIEARPTLVPRLSRPDYGHMVYVTGVSYYEEIEVLLSKFCARGSREWHNYVALHVAKRVPRKDGRGDYQVVRNVEPPYVPPGEKSWAEREKRKNPGVKKYTLSQIFVDSYIQDKYGLSAKLRRDMQLVAITRPADAAATLQEALQAKSPTAKISVSAAGYANTRHQAITAIKAMARGKRAHQAAIQCDVIGNQLLMYGPEGTKSWFVSGPLNNADSVSDVHRLVCHAGMHETMFLFSIETQILGIEISDGKQFISPTVIGHVRGEDEELPADSHPETLQKMNETTWERFLRLARNVRVVQGSTGMLASAVQVDPRMVLVNNHVKQVDENATVAGSQLLGGVPVSQDLWMQRVSGDYEPWKFRGADVGEEVAIMYHNGERVVLSAPFRVDKRSGLNIYSERRSEVVSGMSGGALVALSDMALLGLHCGTTLRHLFAVEFSDAMHLDLVDMLSNEEMGRRATQESADAVVSQLRNRGCHRQFLTAVGRLVPLYDMAGEQVGSAIGADDRLLTTAPAGIYKTDGDVVLEFAALNGFFSVAGNLDPAAQQPLPLVRDPQLHERVVVVGVGRDGHYVSKETHVRQVGTGKKTFMLTATSGNLLPLSGGVVMSAQDGSALGLYVRDSSNPAVGSLSLCVTFPKVTPERANPVHVLESVFPMLHVSSWETTVLSEALRHTSAVHVGGELVPSYRSLAMLGDTELKTRLFRNLYAAKVPADQWVSYFSNLHNNKRLSQLAWDLGLARLLVTQPGVNPPAHSDVYANLLEAIVAVVCLHEESEVVDSFLSILGLVPTVNELVGPTAEYGRMMRRPSELGLPTVSSENDIRLLTPVD